MKFVLSGKLSCVGVLVAQFVCLCVLSTLLLLSWQQLPVEVYFRPHITKEDRRDLMQMFGHVIDLLEAANITYFMDGGTLIGSYRHHGLIPWDDDLDLLVNKSQKQQLEDILHGLDPRYFVFHWRNRCLLDAWKIYINVRPRKGGGHDYSWPFVDINFFDENKTHIWDANMYFKEKYAYEKRYVFPLQQRPFEGWMLPAPCNTEAFIAMTDEPEMCVYQGSHHWLGIKNIALEMMTKTVECKNLQDFIPFVFRTHDKSGYINESLYLSRLMLHSVLLPQKC